ncbi:zf-HC2 domain-containing protein [Granulicella sibirica]|nr:zf-HC2 domain-containing protein [Granulicella sibirica]
MSQFGSTKPGNPQVCAQCEALLMDALDRTASPEDQAFFDRHLASCTACSRMFMDAKRGGAWIEMLRNPRPEPSADLFSRIIAQTSGLQAAEDASTTTAVAPSSVTVMSEFVPVAMPPVAPSPSLYNRPALPADFPGAKVLPFRLRAAAQGFAHTMLQPRLAMTAAMAFFSIALTLNLTGVHLSALTAEDLKPSAIRKSFYEANAHVVRYCDNLRVVYELEARAHDLRSTSDDLPAPAPDNPADPKSRPDDKPEEQKTRPKPGPGTSRREPLFRDDLYRAALVLPNTDPITLTLVNLSPVTAGTSKVQIIPKGDLA